MGPASHRLCVSNALSFLFICVHAGLAWGAAPSSSSYDLAKLPGVVLDDEQGETTGKWKRSSHVSPYVGVGYLSDDNKDKGHKSVRFVPDLPKAGRYHVLIAYTAGRTRASNVPVTVTGADGEQNVVLDETVRPRGDTSFQRIGTFRFEAGRTGSVVISTNDTNGYVNVDAVQFLPEQDHPLESLATATPESRRKSPIDELRSKVTVPLERKPPVKPARTTATRLDALIDESLAGRSHAPLVDDETFLRRADFDLIGRQPTPAELQRFLADTSGNKRAAHVDQRLASDEFGNNWADYWTDTIAYRVPPPDFFLNYKPLRAWFAGNLNANTPWDQVVRELLTASGKITEHPEATFLAYHQCSPVNLASETSRIFLGLQISCAQCHDHPFDSWTRDQYHELAAFFARTQTKAPKSRDGTEMQVSAKEKGEYVMPDANDPSRSGREMIPVFLDGLSLETGKTDAERREVLAAFVTASENPWFAKAYVNRIWGRLLGRGFYEPVDNLSDLQHQDLPTVHEALAAHFLATRYDVKDLMRLVMSTRAYQRSLPAGQSHSSDAPSSDTPSSEPVAAARAVRLRGEEVFAALESAIALPNVTPPAVKPTKAVRYPPPPQSTRDMVAEVFGFDPSLPPADIPRTMNQAMLMMNNDQLQAQVNAAPDSGTMLSKLLAESSDDTIVIDKLFVRVLARRPTATETKLARNHVAAVKERGPAFEDLLWSLLNSTEFTSKR